MNLQTFVSHRKTKFRRIASVNRVLALKSVLLACLVSAMMLAFSATASASFGYVNGLNKTGKAKIAK